MVDPTHARLSIVRQCRLVSVARSSFYYEGTGESPLNLRLLRGIDAQFLETPFYGSRQMTRWLRRQGDTVSRKRVRRLMRLLGGARDLPTAQDVSGGPGAQGLSLPVTRSADHATEPRVVHGCYLYPIAARLSVPRRGDGLGEPQGPATGPARSDMHVASGAPRRHTMPSAQAVGKRGGGARSTSVSQSWKVTGHFFRLYFRPRCPGRGHNRRILLPFPRKG